MAFFAILAIIILFSAVKVVQEYERGVVFRLGRLVGARGPGLILLIPFLERMQKVDLRTVTMDIPAQEVITKDNVTIRVNAVAYFRVTDPNASVVNVADFVRATSQIAQTTLRSVLGQSALDELLSERESINQQLAKIIDDQTEPWGVKVSIVEVKDVELPQSMQRAMARQAEAEREKRAKIIHAEGEFQASQQLSAAAEVINQNPVTIQLRYLQTLTEIGAEKNTTVVFPLPIDLIGNMLAGIGSNGSSDPGSDGRTSPSPAPTRPAASRPDRSQGTSGPAPQPRPAIREAVPRPRLVPEGQEPPRRDDDSTPTV
ncbi:MAG: slipin family protein [Chloroflexia bacterium]|nr:slipin family protein [Chloroflexia bacterium]